MPPNSFSFHFAILHILVYLVGLVSPYGTNMAPAWCYVQTATLLFRREEKLPRSPGFPFGLKGQNGMLCPFLKPATSKGSSVTIDLDWSTFIPWGWGQLSRELWLPDIETKLDFSLGGKMWSGVRVLLGRQLTGISQSPLCPEMHCFCIIQAAPWSKGDVDLGECLAPPRRHKHTVIRWL